MSPKSDKLQDAAARLAEAKEHTNAIEADNKHQLALKKAELGFLGTIFGSHQNAPFYTAAIIAVIALLALIWVFSQPDWAEKAKVLTTILLAALAFAFGRGTKG